MPKIISGVKPMEDKIKYIFGELFKIKSEDFSQDLDVNTVLGWDSMNHLNLIIALEESFNVSFTTEEVILMTNVKAIMRYYEAKMREELFKITIHIIRMAI